MLLIKPVILCISVLMHSYISSVIPKMPCFMSVIVLCAIIALCFSNQLMCFQSHELLRLEGDSHYMWWTFRCTGRNWLKSFLSVFHVWQISDRYFGFFNLRYLKVTILSLKSVYHWEQFMKRKVFWSHSSISIVKLKSLDLYSLTLTHFFYSQWWCWFWLW